MEKQTNADVIVIGCGLSGAVYAHHAALLGRKVLILEKNEDVGGCICSVNYDDGFFTELGAHTIYASYQVTIDMIKSLGLEKNIIPQTSAGYKMLVDGKVVSIFSQLGFFKAFTGALKMISTPKDGQTVREYYTKLFGEANFNKVIHPVTSAVICQDSANVSADLLLKSRKKDKSVPKSFSLKGGLSSLIKSVDKIGDVTVYTKAEVLSVEKNDDVYTVNTNNGSYRAKHVAFAAEPHATAKLIAPISENIGRLLEKLPVHESTAYSVASGIENVGIKPFGYIIGTDEFARSIVSKDTLPHEKYRGFTIHFKMKNFEHKLDGYYQLLQIKDMKDVKTASQTFTLPELRVGHHEWCSELLGEAEKFQNIDILGNYFAGLSMEDCAIRAKECAQRAFA